MSVALQWADLPADGVHPYEVLFDSVPEALLVLSPEGVVLFINSAAEAMFGYPRALLKGRHYEVLFPLGRRQDTGGHSIFSAEPAPASSHRRDDNFSAVRSDGVEFPVSITSARLDDGGAGRIVCSVREVSAHHHRAEELREAMSLLNATLESTADGILVVSSHGRIAGSNDRFAQMWGLPGTLVECGDDAQVMSFVLSQLVDPDAFSCKVQELYADPLAESYDTLEFQDGRSFERYSKPQLVDGQVVGRVWSFRDATPQRRAEDRTRKAMADLAEQAEQLRTLAFQDPLTGLANRLRFQERLTVALTDPEAGSVDVLLLDLDDFKEVNDVHGHDAGDEMLREIGSRLSQCVRSADTVARLGGDEFVALLVRSEDPEAVAARIVAALNRPVLLEGREFQPSVSLGLAGTEGGPAQASDLLRRADIAMYAAKAAGKNRYRLFQPAMMEVLLVRTELETALRKAVERDELVLHFQPVVSAGAREVVQVEALIRWQRPDRLLEPDEFIHTAESSGLISQIGREVLAVACSQVRGWLAGSAERSLAVNVSTIQLREQDFASDVLGILAACEVDPRQVVLEVTESAFMEPAPQVTAQLQRLRRHGIKVALDDFGTGYSSLGRLQELPVDAIKIDKCFVSQIKADCGTLPILTSMVQLAHNLGLQVTAEGIENTTQASHLLDLGCEYLQGYLFSRPQSEGNLNLSINHARARIRRLIID